MKPTLAAVSALLLMAACGRFVTDDNFPDEALGQWGVVSFQLIEEMPNILEFETSGTPARTITINDTTIYGSIGCGISAEYSYDPPKLELGDFFEPAVGDDVDSPCDSEAWRHLLEKTQTVSFPGAERMVWESGASILSFVRMTAD